MRFAAVQMAWRSAGEAPSKWPAISSRPKSSFEASTIEKKPQQLHTLLHSREWNCNFLREPASAKHTRINVFRMVRCANQKYFILRFQLADFGQELFHNLDVVL